MQYQKSDFEDYLNEEEPVYIEGIAFERSRILRELDPDGYEYAFEEWRNGRIQDLLEKAQSLLELYDNKPRFKKLQELVKNKTIVPFIGAGLSMASGYPGWTDFLYQLLPETRIPKLEFDELISSGRYEVAAQCLHESLHYGSFLEVIENHYGINRQLRGPVQLIPYLFPDRVITTNFDNVLERCYANAELPFMKTLYGADSAAIPSLNEARERVLIKLHGEANSSEHRVLTLDEYDKHYVKGGALDSSLRLLSSQTLLFLGCSLTVDRTLSSLAAIAQDRGYECSPRHYAFVMLKHEEDRLMRREHLTSANIFPIWIPESEDPDECIEALLTLLGKGIIES